VLSTPFALVPLRFTLEARAAEGFGAGQSGVNAAAHPVEQGQQAKYLGFAAGQKNA
jgi:hypothetical protein